MDLKQGYEYSGSKKTLIDRVIVTLVIIACTRFGTFIPVPGVDQSYLYQELKNSQILNFFSSFSQGDFFVLGLLTLGILPNINASIIIQLLTSIFPPLQRLQKEEGDDGRRKIIQITRFLTAIIAFQYGLIIGFYLKPFVFGWSIFKAIDIAITLLVGALITLWFSEIITEFGIGNGTSVLIFVNIASTLPNVLSNYISPLATLDLIQVVFILIFLTGIVFIVIIQNAIRKIPLVSVKSLVRSSSRIDQSYLPFRLNPSGIMPLIFTSTLLNSLSVLLTRLSIDLSQNKFFTIGYLALYFLFTLFFSYFYSTIAINPIDLSKDLKRMSFTIPSISPGLATIKFLRETLNRLALLSGLFLAIVVTVPNLMSYFNPIVGGFGRSFGATSVLILVGVTVDLSRQIQTYRIVESYDKLERDF